MCFALLKLHLVCHRPDGLEEQIFPFQIWTSVCHRPDGLEEPSGGSDAVIAVCHRPDGLEV